MPKKKEKSDKRAPLAVALLDAEGHPLTAQWNEEKYTRVAGRVAELSRGLPLPMWGVRGIITNPSEFTTFLTTGKPLNHGFIRIQVVVFLVNDQKAAQAVVDEGFLDEAEIFQVVPA